MVRCFAPECWIDEDWYVGRLREVPGVLNQGASVQELEDNIRDAYQLMMEEEEQVLPMELLFEWGMIHHLVDTLIRKLLSTNRETNKRHGSFLA